MKWADSALKVQIRIQKLKTLLPKHSCLNIVLVLFDILKVSKRHLFGTDRYDTIFMEISAVKEAARGQGRTLEHLKWAVLLKLK